MTRRRAPWWRTTLLLAGCMFASITALAFSELGHRAEEDGTAAVVAILLVLPAAILVPLTLVRRHRAPYVITLVAAGAGIVLPIGATTALVALAGLIGRRRGRHVWWTAGAVTLTTTVAAIRDVAAPTMQRSLIKTLVGPADAPPDAVVSLSWWAVPVLVVIAVAAAVGTGLALRARREARSSAEHASAAQRTTQRLGDELARRSERERIAREVHDVLGHRLSLLSLHAGALESRATGDAELARSAAVVRESAGQSLADLRSLLGVLREPLGDEPADLDLSLADLPAMIDETVHTGVPLSATVYLDHAETAPPELARAVYRIVQELLTNARKHAPGEQISLSVSGGPQAGVTIDSRNHYVAPTEASTAATDGARQGLQGIAERTELLGGHLAYGLTDGEQSFRVTVTLPWQQPGS